MTFFDLNRRKAGGAAGANQGGAKRYKPGQVVNLERGSGQLKGRLAERMKGRIAWKVVGSRKK